MEMAAELVETKNRAQGKVSTDFIIISKSTLTSLCGVVVVFIVTLDEL